MTSDLFFRRISAWHLCWLSSFLVAVSRENEPQCITANRDGDVESPPQPNGVRYTTNDGEELSSFLMYISKVTCVMARSSV